MYLYWWLATVILFQIGKSLFDEEGSKLIHKICDKAKEKGVNLYFPIDFVATSKFAEDTEVNGYCCLA